MNDDSPAVEVVVPPADWQPTADQAKLWRVTALVFSGMEAEVGFDMAVSLFLSRIASELRLHVGLEAAEMTLHLFAEGMHKMPFDPIGPTAGTA